MYRLLNLGVIAGLVLAAAYVYDIKYQSTLRAERVAKLRQDLRRERDVIASLRAEWARLSEPRRIQALSERHLSLAPVRATQFDDFDSLPQRPMPAAPDDPIAATVERAADAPDSTGSVNSPATGERQ